MHATRREFFQSAAGAAVSLAFGCSPPTSSGGQFSADPGEQNTKVDETEIEKSLDAMAAALAQKENPTEAWKLIFQKPDKPWSNVKAAVKFNEVGTNKPRVAVLNKLCTELIGLGIPAGNVTIYGGANTGAAFLYNGPIAGDASPRRWRLRSPLPCGQVPGPRPGLGG